MSPPVHTELSSQIRNIVKELAKNHELNEVRKLMETRHCFKATKAQYERIFRDLGIQKTHSSEDWKVLDMKLKVRKRKGRESDVYDHGRLMDAKKLRKEISRNGMTSTEESLLASASVPSAKTPPCFELYTPKGPPVSRTLFRNLPILKFQEALFAAPMSNSGSVTETSRVIVQQLLKRPTTLEDDTPSLAGIEAILPNSALLDEDSACFLALKSHEDLNTTILLNVVLYVTSNNFPGGSTPGTIYKAIREQGNTSVLDALLVREDLTAKAAVEKLFRCAVETGDVQVVKRCLDAGLDPNEHVCEHREIYGHLTPMQYACISRNTAMVQALIQGKSRIDEPGAGSMSSALTLAIGAAYYLKLDGQVPTKNQINILDCESSGDSGSLHVDDQLQGERAVRNLRNLVSILLDAGAKVNPLSPFHVRFLHGNYAYEAQFLFDDGLSPLAVAAKFRQNAIVTMLIENGADVNSVSHRGRSILQECLRGWVHEGNRPYLRDYYWSFQVNGWFGSILDIVRKLLGAKVDPNYCLKPEECPLALAALSCEVKIAELLLSAGAEITLESIVAAVRSGYPPTLDLLLSTGFKVDLETTKQIILESRPEASWLSLVKMLLDSQPDFELWKFAALGAIKFGSVALWTFLTETRDCEVFDLLENNLGIESAIEKCCFHGTTDVLCLILDHARLWGYQISHLLGGTLQHTMQMEDRTKIPNVVEMLLDAGADVNAVGCSLDDCSCNSEPAIYHAIRNGEIDIVDRLIRAGADIFFTIPFRDTCSALSLAIESGNLMIVERLLNAGAHLDTRMICFKCYLNHHASSGHLLVAAVKTGNMPIITSLVEHGAAINEPGSIHDSWCYQSYHICKLPLTVAIQNLHWDCAEYLIRKGAAVENPIEILMSETPLSAAIDSKNDSIIQRLLEAGAHPGHPQVLKSALSDFGLFQNLIWRLEHRCPISPRANLGGEALRAAIDKGCFKSANFLFQKKLVDVNLDSYQYFGIYEALYPQHMAEYHIQCEFRKRDPRPFELSFFKSHLLNAVSQNSMVMMELLLKSGANPDQKYGGYSPLVFAASKGLSQAVSILIEFGADVNAPLSEIKDKTALQWTAQKGYLGIAFKLIESGADVNACGSRYGWTALELAAQEGRLDMVQMLLNAGAKIYGEGDAQYQRALKFATYNRHHTVRKLLEDYHG